MQTDKKNGIHSIDEVGLIKLVPPQELILIIFFITNIILNIITLIKVMYSHNMCACTNKMEKYIN